MAQTVASILVGADPAGSGVGRFAPVSAGHPDELRGAIAEAFAVDGPAIVDCVVAADEMPNLPHIDLGLAKNYAIAKIKEAVIAATRR